MNHATMSLGSNLLLMTCRVRVEAADASMTDRDARALLDSVSYQCPLFLNTLRRGFTCLGTAYFRLLPVTFLLDLLPVLKSPPFTLIGSSALRL